MTLTLKQSLIVSGLVAYWLANFALALYLIGDFVRSMFRR